jgi:hypothetical protein
VLKHWDFIDVDSLGLCGGLITCWNSSLSMTNTFVVYLGLCTEFWSKGLGQPLKVMNLYDPYGEKQCLGDSCSSGGLGGEVAYWR